MAARSADNSPPVAVAIGTGMVLDALDDDAEALLGRAGAVRCMHELRGISGYANAHCGTLGAQL
jgi:hypothetical protein